MAVLVGNHTKLIVQGITGREGLFHAKGCRDYGTKVVGGVTPGKGGTEIDGFPVFNTVKEAVAKTGANATMIFVPPVGAADAILEALDAGIVNAAKEIGIQVPVVVRLEGTNVEEGKKILADSGLNLIVAADLEDAAVKVVASVK